MSKKTIQLSELVQQATSDLNPNPPIQRFALIANVVNKIEASGRTLRLQIIGKMKQYISKVISSKEMYYVLCMTDYLVCNAQKFRKQVLDIDFIALLEVIGEFKKQTKSSKSKNIVIEKSLSVVQSWGTKFPNELSEYLILYQKYVQMGVKFPKEVSVAVKTPPKDIPKKAVLLIDKIRKFDNEITQVMKEATDVTELVDLYKRSTDLNRFECKNQLKLLIHSELIEIQLKLTEQTLYKQEQIDKFNALVNNYQSSLQLLANSINSNKTDRHTTVITPIDSHSPLIQVQNDNSGTVSPHLKNAPVERHKFSVKLAQPPKSNGLPIRNPISRTFSLWANNALTVNTVSTDHFFTTDCLDCDKVEDESNYDDCETEYE
ncbi:VHS domain-containing protein [Entamoeba marina]